MENGVTYVGVKSLQAKPMNRADYCNLRGWDVPADEDKGTEGYLVEYPDGYISWTPTPQFEEAYVPVDDSEYKTDAIVRNARRTVEGMAYSHQNLCSSQGQNGQYVRAQAVEVAARACGSNGDGIVPLAKELLAFIEGDDRK